MDLTQTIDLWVIKFEATFSHGKKQLQENEYDVSCEID